MSLDARRRTTTACTCVDGTIGARTTRSAALGRHDDSLAARRSLGGLAGVGSDRAEPAMQRRRGAVMSLDTRRTRHGVRVRVSTARSAHARRGRRRSVGTTTRSRLGARSAGVAGVGSDRAEPAMQRKRRGDVTRHTAHTTRRACARVDGAIGARTTRSAALGRHDDSLAARRSLGGSPVSALTEPSRRCNARGAVMSLDTRRTRHGVRVRCRRRDRRTHDEVGGARSARRLARGSALARRASPVSALREPSRRCDEESREAR